MPLTWLEEQLLGGIIKYIAKRTRGGHMFKDMLLKNWVTTAIGIIGAVVLVLNDLISRGTLDDQTIILAVSTAILGAVSKSFNVSGTKP